MEETDTLRRVPDLDAILHYHEEIELGRAPEAYGELLKRRTTKLAGDLSRSVATPLARLVDLDNKLHRYLLADDSEEMTYEDFVVHELPPVLQKLNSQPRVMVGFSGTAAGGKTTAADKCLNDIVAHWQKYGLRIKPRMGVFSFDDFLREKEDRVPQNTEDPYLKFNVNRYVAFVHDVSRNKRATQPLYDQTSKGQLKFSLDASGNILIHNGNRTVTIKIYEDGALSFQEIAQLTMNQVKEREKEGRPYKHIVKTDTKYAWVDLTEERGKPHDHVALAESFLCGSTPIQIERRKEGAIKITLRDAEFYIRMEGNNRLLEVEGEKPVELAAGKKAEALKVWKPAEEGGAQIVIGEGMLLLESPDWDISASVNAGFMIRRRRSGLRELARGRGAKDVEENIRALAKRQRTEDLPADALRNRFNQQRGARTRQRDHFQVTSHTLAEAIVRNAYYNLIGLRQFIDFRGDFPLERPLKDMSRFSEQELVHWIARSFAERERESKPFSNPEPDPFHGEKALVPAETFERYWAGQYVTLAIGQFLLLKFQLDQTMDGPRFGYLSPATVHQLEKLFARSYGLFAGAQILNLEGRLGGSIKYKALTKLGNNYEDETQEAILHKVLIMDQIPFVEGRLNQIAAAYKNLVEARRDEEAQRKLEEGYYWIDAFMSLQAAAWRRGIVDIAPDIARRYGIGFFHGKETMHMVAPSSLLLDNSALLEVEKIAGSENQKSLEGYETLAGYQTLRGFQRRFVRGPNEDYLESIPQIFHSYYIQSILENVPEDAKGMRRGFGQRWETVLQSNLANQYQNLRVSAAIIDDAEISYMEEILAKLYLDRFQAFFADHFEHAAYPPGNPQLAWACLYDAWLPEGTNDSLPVFVKVFYRMLLENPKLLENMKAKEMDDSGTAEGIAILLDKEVDRIYRERGENPPVQRNVEKRILKEFILSTLRLPFNWKTRPAEQALGLLAPVLIDHTPLLRGRLWFETSM